MPGGRPAENLVGKCYGHLTVLKLVSQQRQPSGSVLRVWLCECKCGNTFKKKTRLVRLGPSCGCDKLDHGHAKRGKLTPTYRSWYGMHTRCSNPNQRSWPDYGGRGIKVCEAWGSFENFLADMGERPSINHSIDRYPDGDGNYEPGNCRWATRTQQNRNRKNVK